MKVQFEIDDKLLADVVGGANISYWGDADWVNRDNLSLRIQDREDGGQWQTVGRAAFEVGIAKMLVGGYSHHITDIIQKNYDMYTGDILVQFAVFGEEKYA